jgi:hypothetical protein
MLKAVCCKPSLHSPARHHRSIITRITSILSSYSYAHHLSLVNLTVSTTRRRTPARVDDLREIVCATVARRE